jgi:hypothetical protein
VQKIQERGKDKVHQRKKKEKKKHNTARGVFPHVYSADMCFKRCKLYLCRGAGCEHQEEAGAREVFPPPCIRVLVLGLARRRRHRVVGLIGVSGGGGVCKCGELW